MLIKFDHITFSCSKNNIYSAIDEYPNYSILFYDNVKNLSVKKKDMYNYCSTHDIVLLVPKNENSLPIEITAYETTTPNIKAPLTLINYEKIQIHSSKIEETEKLLLALGFKKNGVLFHYKSIFAPRNVCIEIVEVNSQQCCKFDLEGYTCLAFMSNSAEKERARLCINFHCSNLQNLDVNGKKLELFFVYGTAGEIIEIFSIAKENI